MSIIISNVGQKNISTRSLEFLNFFLFIMGLDDHGNKTSYTYNPSQKNAFLDFCTLSCQHHKWMTQLDTIEKHNHSNHQNPKIIYTKSFYMAMFMITVKIIFTVFWLFCWHLKDILSNKTAILEQQSYWHHLGKCFVSTIWHLG